MGGGFTFAGNSAATPPFSPSASASAGAPRSFKNPDSVTAIRGGSQSRSQKSVGCNLRSVPSRAEVQSAIIELQRFMHGLSTSNNGLQGLPYHHESKMLEEAPGFRKFYDAFSMMQEEPSFMNLVTSLSCDKAVWEAILSNKAVQDQRGSISAAKEEKLLSYYEEADIVNIILRWIMGFKKLRVFELVEKFGLLVNDIFQPGPNQKATSDLTDLLDEKIRSSLLLTVVIILIVVVTRSQE